MAATRFSMRWDEPDAAFEELSLAEGEAGTGHTDETGGDVEQTHAGGGVDLDVEAADVSDDAVLLGAVGGCPSQAGGLRPLVEGVDAASASVRCSASG
jgi:hypothetical protein